MKIAIVCSLGSSLIRFRGDLIRELCALGHEVITYSPPVDGALGDRIRALGAEHISYPLDRASTNPWHDFRSFLRLRRSFKKYRPDIVFSYTAKPMIYGSFAGSAAGAKRIVSLVTGLGYAFTNAGWKQRILRTIQLFLYRKAFSANACVVFQNSDDRRFFVDRRVLDQDKAGQVAGSGVNLDEFDATPVSSPDPFCFLMVARLLREKGVEEYLEAARMVNARFPGRCRFVLVGGSDPNPGALNVESLKEENEIVEFLGHREDVGSQMQQCHCFVLPSYREGTPRSVLEALASARPVITTDAVGCRETVIPGSNGWLVEVQDCASLAQAMFEAVELPPTKLKKLGEASRRMAEEIFDVRKVNREMIGYILGSEVDFNGSSQ